METFEAAVRSNIAKVKTKLDHLDIEAVAREAGILQRTERKLSANHFLLALLALSTGRAPTLERIAAVVQLIIGDSFSKQAVSKRIGLGIDQFLGRIVAGLFSELKSRSDKKGLFAAFNRVLLQDSTTLKLPDRFRDSFPGSANQSKRTQSSMKIQLVSDLLGDRIVQLSISGFTRNDQAASGDILSVARAGDLILRDLGYFVTGNFKLMNERGIFFLSRWHRGTTLIDPETGEPIDLCKKLRKHGELDINVLLGKKHRVVARLVCSRLGSQRAPAESQGRSQKGQEVRAHERSPLPDGMVNLRHQCRFGRVEPRGFPARLPPALAD